jgi:uncharacterized membrane protein
MPLAALILLAGCLQVLALGIALGGTLFIWLRSRAARSQDPVAYRLYLLLLAAKFERWFWLSLGLLMIAGFGGLAASNASPPPSGLGWPFLVAALLLLVFGALATLRTLSMIQLSLAGDNASPRALRLFPLLYGGTGLALVGVALLALALARTLVAVPGV